ncbi:MAG: class I SAM-dependent methyltransferase [Chitinophagales bacterium]
MNISEAIQLIIGDTAFSNHPNIWADLGCGSGLFTYALANLLPKQSTIIAVDKSYQLLQESNSTGVRIEFLQANFEKDVLVLPPLNGILMANSLHYVKDKKSLLERLQTHFNTNGRFIIVEYDTLNTNSWVPFPIDYPHLRELFLELGFKKIEKIGVHPSIYGSNIYSCLVT